MPLCRQCEAAMLRDTEAWIRRFRSGAFVALAVAGIPFLILVACCRNANLGGLLMALVGADAIVAFGALLFLAFAGIWGRAAITNRTAALIGEDSIRFGNLDYQRRFESLNH